MRSPAISRPSDEDAAMSAAQIGRRRFLLAAGAAAGLGAFADRAAPAGASPSSARVVVVGGGYGGATAAKYIRLLSGGRIDVTLIEPEPAFVSCPLSNLVLGGMRTLDDLTVAYGGLVEHHGVRLVRDRVAGIDAERRRLRLDGGDSLGYDKLVLAPGVEMIWGEVQGLKPAHDTGRVLQAWNAGPETLALRRQIEAMADGGTFAIVIPELPYRCPPGPYERACIVADYFKRSKPKSKVLIIDANPDVTSKGALFRKAWAELYPGMIEYRPQHKATAVDAATTTAMFEVQDDLRADVLNLLPPMRAGALAVQAGLANANARWCQVDFLNFESTVAKHIHVIGDAIQIAPAMPKSGHMANSHAKVCAAAIVAELSGWEIDPQPMLTNTCYSYVAADQAIHVTSVHAYLPAQRTYQVVDGSGGVSVARSPAEARIAQGWARNIWADMLE
jgi:sulfide dehydrogenase [flavocytochrome c] flavoprotein subunit